MGVRDFKSKQEKNNNFSLYYKINVFTILQAYILPDKSLR